MLGSICPSFFLLPLAREELLGVPVYESWEAQRKLATGRLTNGPLAHLGTGWIFGVWYSHLYVEPYHQVTGCC
jgi:hypothetical protein